MKNNFIETSISTISLRATGQLTLQHMQTAARFYYTVCPARHALAAKKVAKGAQVLFEGAQSVMLDVTKGCVRL